MIYHINFTEELIIELGLEDESELLRKNGVLDIGNIMESLLCVKVMKVLSI